MARKNNGEPKTFAYEEFLARARKEGRVRNEELSMKVLKPDLSLQARVNHIDVDHVRALHDILKNGQALAPIIVFEIDGPKGKVFKIADGFHRHEVYKREGKPGIPCIVVSGTLQEAIEYAASANQALGLPRTKADTKKAVFMLFENGWLHRSSPSIAKAVGLITGPTVTRYRLEYCQLSGEPYPDEFKRSDGTSIKGKFRTDGGVRVHKADRGYYAMIGGERRYLGTNGTDAELLANEIAKRTARHGGASVQASHIAERLTRFGIFAATASVCRFIGGYVVGNMSFVGSSGAGTQESTLAMSAKVLAVARHTKSARAVVVRLDRSGVQASVEEVMQILGVEFMTPDEFVAAVKAEQRDSAPVAANA